MVKLRSPSRRSSQQGTAGCFASPIVFVLATLGAFLVGRFSSLPSDDFSGYYHTSLDTLLGSMSSSQLVQHNAVKSEADTSGNSNALATLPNKVMPDFKQVGRLTGTDKVKGSIAKDNCQADPKACKIFETNLDIQNPQCRTKSSHYYDSVYNRWLAPFGNSEPFQMLEIGFYHGSGYDAFRAFLPSAEIHSCEISCIKDNPLATPRKWEWDNFAAKNSNYQSLLQQGLLHCYDASNVKDLEKLYRELRKSNTPNDNNNNNIASSPPPPPPPPLKVVIDDAAHVSSHMVTSLFYWFPRIEPGGIMVIEDIQPVNDPNNFRLRVIPQLMHDIHYCGGTAVKEKVCFAALQPLIKSISCELHICVLERNDVPADPNAKFQVPPNALQENPECLYK